MTQSCSQWQAANDLQSEISKIESAIQPTSSQTGVDNRFILAIIMRESNGYVRAPTTGNVPNTGLMQSYNGTGTCNSNGTVLNPCPQGQITQMVGDGS